MSQSPSVFISYSRYDRHAAFTIKRLLEENSVRVWLDVISIKVSSQLLQELYDNIDRHDIFCLLLSPTSVASPWCLKEIEHAKSKEGLRFVPVILRSCKIPTDLDNTVALDAREGLNYESVRSRLLRALCGDGIVEDAIVFTQLQQDLLANSQIIEEGESLLPTVKSQLVTIADESIRRIDLEIEMESLPEDGSAIELRLKLGLWKGVLSIFIARYHEDHTWPRRFGFEECEYTEFYRKRIHRLDVRLRWNNYTQKMSRVIHDDQNLAKFYAEFDGHEFRPDGLMPTSFEISSLNALARDWSKFELFAHESKAEDAKLIDHETDVRIELFGKISEATGKVSERSIRLYRSGHTYKQETLFRCPSILSEDNSIWKEVLVHACDPVDTLSKSSFYAQDLRPEILAALDEVKTNWNTVVFASVDELRLVAHALVSRGGIAHRIRGHYAESFQRFNAAFSLFNSLSAQDALTEVDILAIVECLELPIRTSLNYKNYANALNLGKALKSLLANAARAQPQLPDYARLLADANLLIAEALSKLEQGEAALAELNNVPNLYHAIYIDHPSQKCRLAYVEALQRAIRDSKLWKLEQSSMVQRWTTAMEKEVGVEIASKLLIFKNEAALPVWLVPITLSMWPTIPIYNAALRYALNLPKRWISQPLVRGTATQIEHVYWGNASQDAEWLCIDFMGNVQESFHSFLWIDSGMLLTDLPQTPIHDDPARGPKKRSWHSLGGIPALAKKLEADEAYGWIGVFEYKREYVMLGRVYALVIRRGKFAWKIILSFQTAVLENRPEKVLESNDHVRAGAILGDLRLDSIPRLASSSNLEGITPPEARQSSIGHDAQEPDQKKPPLPTDNTDTSAATIGLPKGANRTDSPGVEHRRLLPLRTIAARGDRSPSPGYGHVGFQLGILPPFQLRRIYGDHDPVD